VEIHATKDGNQAKSGVLGRQYQFPTQCHEGGSASPRQAVTFEAGRTVQRRATRRREGPPAYGIFSLNRRQNIFPSASAHYDGRMGNCPRHRRGHMLPGQRVAVLVGDATASAPT
jgi:hypothetical protein